MDVLKIKNFCTPKDTINILTRQHTEWEKIFVNHIFVKRLISRICKLFLWLKEQPDFFKWAKNLNVHFSKNRFVNKKLQVLLKEMKEYSNKWTESLWKYLYISKEEIQISNKHMPWCQQHKSLGKYKSKPKWDNTSCLLDIYNNF